MLMCEIVLNRMPRIHHCEARWRWRPPVFDDYDFWGVLQGKGELHCNARRFELKAGEVFVFRPGDVIHATQNPDRPLSVIAFHFLPGEQFPFELDRMPMRRQVANLDELEFYARQAVRFANTRNDGLAQIRCRLAALELLALFVDEHHSAERSLLERLNSVADSIRSAPGEVGSVEGLSKKCGLSPAYFSKKFKEQFGSSPVEFWIQARAERAEHLLNETDLSIGTIAEALGYSDVFHFSKQFKQLRGMAPRQFRRDQLLAVAAGTEDLPGIVPPKTK